MTVFSKSLKKLVEKETKKKALPGPSRSGLLPAQKNPRPNDKNILCLSDCLNVTTKLIMAKDTAKQNGSML